MYSENPIKTAAAFFMVILGGGLLSALLGGLFAALIALISPEFVSSLFSVSVHGRITRYALGVGMIWGLLIGAAAAGFSCMLAAVIKVLQIRLALGDNAKGRAGS